GTRQGQERRPYYAQAEHRRCSRQGLVRRQGRRGIHFQAGRRQVPANRTRANGRLAQDRSSRALDGAILMRGIVIAKMLVLTLWGLYLTIGLTRGAGTDESQASSPALSSQHLPVCKNGQA